MAPAPFAQQNIQEIPIKMAGGNNYGRYPKISAEETFNFIVSQDALVPYAGYKAVVAVGNGQIGRGIWASTAGDFILGVWGSQVYRLQQGSGAPEFVGTLETGEGDVFISENNKKQICITDKTYVYVYNWDTRTFYSNVPGDPNLIAWSHGYTANPGYVSYLNGYLMIALEESQDWVLSQANDALNWPTNVGGTSFVGQFQNKPSFVIAAAPTPGGGNNMLLLGQTGAAAYQFNGAALFPFQRNSTNSIDYGCLNASSIAAMENYIVWLASSDLAGPTIMVYDGGTAKQISTEGINYQLSNLEFPEDCTGFLFRQDGHLIYQFTFVRDNLTFAYDFNTQLFFTITDPFLNYHPARQVVFYNNNYYFVSLNGDNLYQFGTQYTDAILSVTDDSVSEQIPRIRVTAPFRLPTQRYFIIKSFGFTIENGQPNRVTTTEYPVGYDMITEITEDTMITEDGDTMVTESRRTSATTVVTVSEAVDLSISRDGGETFGSSWRHPMNRVGKRKSRFIWQRLGQCNDCTLQIRFNGFGRFVVIEPAIMEIFQ